MKALALEKGQLAIKDFPEPLPSRGETLIKVLKAGICNTDLELAKGYMKFEGVLGHEFVGQVVKASKVSWEGKRVVGEINLPCGKCRFCQEGLTNHCPSRQVLGISGKNGAFAEFLTLPLANIHPLPQGISDLEAVFIEPLAAAFEILEQVRIKNTDSVLVLGDGKLGLLIAQIMKLKTPRVSCLGKHKRKLKILEEEGIKAYFSRKRVRREFDHVVEATGNKTGLSEALSLVKPRGTVILKSTFWGEVKVNISKIVVDEVQLIGSRCGPFLKAIDVLRKKQVNVNKMVDGDFPLEKAKEAFAFAKKPGIIKVLITP